MIDTLVGSINDFTQEAITPRVQPAIEAWLAQPVLNDEERWSFYHVFWPFLIPQILAAAAYQLATKPWPAFDAASYPVPERNHQDYLRESPLFQTLEALCRHAIEELPTALRLLIEFTAKHPNHFAKALGFLQSTAHFKGFDYQHQGGLYVQEMVVKVLQIGTKSTPHAAFYQWLTAHVVPGCLATTFRGVRPSHKANSILMTNDELPNPTDYLKSWRASLWQLLFDLYPTHPQLVIDGINTYKQSIHDGDSSVHWHHWDAERLIPFLDTHLDSTNFADCYLVQHYCDWYSWYKKAIPHAGFVGLRSKFYSPLYRLYDLLIYQHQYRRYTDRTHRRFYENDERDAYILNRTKPLQYKRYDSYTKLIDQFNLLAEKIIPLQGKQNKAYQLPNSIAVILFELFERDQTLGKRVLSYLFSTGNPVCLTPFETIRALAQQDAQDNFQLISSSEYQSKASWQLLFIKSLPANQVSYQWLQELMRVFRTHPTNFNIYNLEHFEHLSKTWGGLVETDSELR